jgi:16S rRNA (guanine(1405)-N(7))-methyltransferase
LSDLDDGPASAQIVERVLSSSRYRDVDRALLDRLAVEELTRARNADDAVKRVKRRLHQAVGAFRGRSLSRGLADAWHGDLDDPAFRAACVDVLRSHASTRERIDHLTSFYVGIWAHTGVPQRLLEIGCGLGPIALPWMGIGSATYLATDVDRRVLAPVRDFLELVGQPHSVWASDAVTDPPSDDADVALLLKLVPTLDRQDPSASARLLKALHVRHAVVSFPARSLGGRAKGMERSSRGRLERLIDETGRVSAVAEASVPNELVFVLTLDA